MMSHSWILYLYHVPVVSFGSQTRTFYVTFSKEQELRVFENKVMKIVRPARDVVTGSEKIML
jgi:hypothetical protein